MIGHRSENLAGEAEEEIRAYFHTANNKNVENSSCFIFANDSSESSKGLENLAVLQRFSSFS